MFVGLRYYYYHSTAEEEAENGPGEGVSVAEDLEEATITGEGVSGAGRLII